MKKRDTLFLTKTERGQVSFSDEKRTTIYFFPNEKAAETSPIAFGDFNIFVELKGVEISRGS